MKTLYSTNNRLQTVMMPVLMALAIYACAQKVKTTQVSIKQEQEKAYVYECPDEMRFVTQVQGEELWLFLPDKTIKLVHVESASGSKYSTGDVTFWGKGEMAQLWTDKGNYRDCKINRQQSIWETAKLNGVDFRAIGNEPGWHLELRNAETIKLVTDYGATINIFKTPEPVSDLLAGKTIYKTGNDDHDLVITLEGKICLDTMSGEDFETTVVVILDGNEYSGCGRALH